MKDLGIVDSVSTAVDLLGSDDFIDFHRHEVKDFSKETLYRFPFGIWFRGQANAKWKLVPAIFRRHDFDESSMFNHFQIRAPEYRNSHRSVFDWLCLMQHYNLPTRLLDWSESVLVALFFAAQGSRRVDGKVYALNARRLNFLTNSRKWSDGERANVCTPWSLDVAARAQLTVSKTHADWKHRMSSMSDMESWRTSECREIAQQAPDLEALATPTGVLPSRLNGRMVFQSSAFTLHGASLIFAKKVWREKIFFLNRGHWSISTKAKRTPTSSFSFALRCLETTRERSCASFCCWGSTRELYSRKWTAKPNPSAGSGDCQRSKRITNYLCRTG